MPWNKGIKGQIPWNKGIRTGISPANKGIPTSDEQKQKLSKALKGKPLSEAHKAKMKGRKSPNWKHGKSNTKEYISHMKRIWKMKRRQVHGSHTFGEWELLKKQYNYRCPSCGKNEPEIKLTEDHIIPTSKGGSNNIENIQPLCALCNSKKSTKIIYYINEEW